MNAARHRLHQAINPHAALVACGALAGLAAGCNDGIRPTREPAPSPASAVALPSPPQQSSPSTQPLAALLRDDFEGRSLADFWLPGDQGSGRYAPGAVVMTREFARGGRQSARITVRTGDVAQVGDSGRANERAELDSGAHPLLGRDVWCGYSLRIPADFPVVDTRLVISQWKQSGLPGSPIAAQRFMSGRHYLTIRDLNTLGDWRQTTDLPRLAPGRWHDLIWHVRFAADATGLVELWMNGVRSARIAGPTASPRGRDAFYHKVGLYRDRMAEPMTMYVDSYALGDAREKVDPSLFHSEPRP